MRTSFLSRSVITAASLAIGSVALAATPANAASASGVTRDMVLTAVNGVRAADAAESNLSIATARALRSIAVRGCDVRTDEDEYSYLQNVAVTSAGDDADGLLITAYVNSGFGGHSCTVAAFAATDAAFQLSGSATITQEQYDEETDAARSVTLQASTLSGDAFVTAPLVDVADDNNLSVSATGNATRTSDITTSTKVADKKSNAQKKAAKSKYNKQLKAAKKAYTKALDKAGKSKAKKSAAKKAYAKKKATAAAEYKNATASFKIVTTTTKVVAETRPFSITTVLSAPVPS